MISALYYVFLIKGVIPIFTKKDFAIYIIEDFLENVNYDSIDEEHYELLERDILKWASLGVALEYLQKIKNPIMQDHVKGKNPIFISTTTSKLRLREMFDLLPE